MTEPSGLEYAVRDRDGRIVVAFRPVETLLGVIEALTDSAKAAGAHAAGGVATPALKYHVGRMALIRKLLGLEPAPDASTRPSDMSRNRS